MRIFQRPVPAAELLLVLSFTLLACKLGKSEDDPESRELPVVPSAPTATPATPPATPQVPVPAPAVPTPPPATEAAAVTTGSAEKPGTTGAANTTGTAVKPGTTTGAAASTTGAVSTTGTTGTAATTTGTAQQGTTGGTITPECLSKCAERMRKCLADAKLGDDVATKCNGAFQACQRDCS